MREMLEPLFGAGGAIVAQFVITLAVVLALVAVVVWLVRRYAAGGLGSTVRGRLPRLAVVDAVAIDNRRKLVLVRRDHVEHLLLIGGPTDVLVEPGILRARTVAQRGPAAQAQAAAARQAAANAVSVEPPAREMPVAPPPPEPVPAEPPIPFPPRRVERPIARRELPRQSVPVAEGPPVRRGPLPRPAAELAAAEEARITPFVSVAPSRLGLAPVPDDEAPPSIGIESLSIEPDEAMPPDIAAEPEGPVAVEPGGESEPESREIQASDSPTVAAEEAPSPGDEAGDTAARVNDLEREMARLLGEISSRGSS